jgi:ABC-type multidrug transport system ATPase subunit
MGTASDMWVEENMSIADSRGHRRGVRWAIRGKDREKYREQLKLLDLGLEDRLTTKMGLLSGGQRQAITLLMAAMKKPKLLLLDEHTAALDPKTAAKVLEITDKLISENGLTALMVTHNMRDAIAHGNRIIMMNAGKIVLDIKGEEKKKLTVEALAEACSISKFHFCRVFKEVTGLTAVQYLNKYRIDVAEIMLKSGTDGISTVAWKCGFNSAAYFIKQFKAHTGITPKQYRKKHIDSIY